MWPFASHDWKATAVDKRSLRSRAIEDGLAMAEKNLHIDSVSGDVDQYLSATAAEIVENIGTRKKGWTATTVVSAYIKQAVAAHSTTNCITEVLFAQALEQAAELDREFANTGQMRGPLHGVPMTLKDQLQLPGVDATIGFTTWSHQHSTEYSPIVECVIKAGGIPIAKTNVPQTMLSFECSNPLWGRSLNPFSADHTPGGSSGGEGAILACDGSALGIGSDVGGSLRIPAHFCGIYSLKPTVGRMGLAGAKGCTPGFEAIRTTAGPMGRSVSDVELGSRTLFAHAVDSYAPLPPVPYRDVTLPQRLKFGYYTSDRFIKASPACQRAVLETVEALRKQGHECIEFEPPDMLEAMKIFNGLVSSDGFSTLLSHIQGDPREPSLFLVTLGPRLPGFLRTFGAWVLENFIGDPIFGNLLRGSRTKSVKEFWSITKDRDAYIRRFNKEVWDKHGFDGILTPPSASPAVPHGGTTYLASMAGATILYNLVDSPAAIVPVTRVDPTKDALTPEFWSTPDHGSKLWEDRLYNGAAAVYNPEAMKGLPLGVQIVGRLWEDEKVVEMMKVVDNALGPRGFGPGSRPKNPVA